MKNCIYKFIPAILCCVFLAGCDKYLDIKPKGATLLTTVADYDQWLNDPVLVYGVGWPYGNLNYLGDNMDVPTIAVPPASVAELIYTWASQYSTLTNAVPAFWSDHYTDINKYNTVLLGIDGATGGTNAQRRSLKAEALLGRAFEYFYLVNEYGKEFDSATVIKDLAVPFVTAIDVTQTVPGRSTIADIYNHIITDINTAIPDLPADNSVDRYRGSVAAAYSVLARVYFYAGDYADAQKNAQLALDNSKAVMIDFNGTLPTAALVSTQPDVIYGRMIAGNATPTLNFMRTFATNDLRVKKLYYSSDSYTFTVRGGSYFYPALVTPYFTYTNTGTSVQEMRLIIAESAARSNDLSTALQQLDNVRRARFATAGYVSYQSGNRDSVLQTVLLERSHELPFSELRWFDMRRLDMDNRMDIVYRYDGQGNVLAKLSPHSNSYTLQIPLQVLNYNPGMPQNP